MNHCRQLAEMDESRMRIETDCRSSQLPESMTNAIWLVISWSDRPPSNDGIWRSALELIQAKTLPVSWLLFAKGGSRTQLVLRVSSMQDCWQRYSRPPFILLLRPDFWIAATLPKHSFDFTALARQMDTINQNCAKPQSYVYDHRDRWTWCRACDLQRLEEFDLRDSVLPFVKSWTSIPCHLGYLLNSRRSPCRMRSKRKVITWNHKRHGR